jgi:ribonucleoside-diphosphate reductase subunit M1
MNIFIFNKIIIKKDGRRQTLHFEKILNRISKLVYGLNCAFIQPVLVAQKVFVGVYEDATTSELDELAAETSATMITTHPDYAKLASRIVVSNCHKSTMKSFFDACVNMYDNSKPKFGKKTSLLSDEFYEIICKNVERIDSEIVHENDYEYDYFGFRTLEKSYLLKIDAKIVERPQHMLMRVAASIYKDNIASLIRTYQLMSRRCFTHASPTLFNAGTQRPQLSSCFLVCMKDDSIEGIYETLKECAMISKSAGGIGLSCHNIRAAGSYIRGTNGNSNGIVPMLRVFNDTARYVDQGGGKRKGAFAIYLEPWHAEIFEWLELRKNHGKEETRARDLFYGLWVNDLFMERVACDKDWSLFCPNESPGLDESWGHEFELLYNRYELEGRCKRIIKAQQLWFAILEAQIETGNPYMLYKDHCNRKSNQQNLGTIRSSNLCTEIIEFSNKYETAVCNLASIALPRFVRENKGVKINKKLVGSISNSIRYFDFSSLSIVCQEITNNLDQIIDSNYYPVETARISNLSHRPIGLGIQGLADTLILLGLPFDSNEARLLNREIFECIYYSSLKASCELAKYMGHYKSYHGCPVSKGILQHDMWDVKPASKRWEWDFLRFSISRYGVRNSLLVAPMPTATTSQILGNNECFEPYTCNIYTRRVLSGEFIVVNPHLLDDLTEIGIWDFKMKDELILSNGSVHTLDIPLYFKEIYRTVWEIKQRDIVSMASERGAFIDQSQSLNIHMSDPNFGKLSSLHFHSWRMGLKTGMYYLRTRSAASAIKVTVEHKFLKEEKTKYLDSHLRIKKKFKSILEPPCMILE